ncbi:hypothetical protein [Streptomyces sediminimaris]|uniref:hypothetical protein n=1 Tax=Streptomyces sediminimaris TaxID=3383721 RepID=UPI00399B09CB
MAGATVREVVRDVVAETAPGELVILDGLDTADEASVTRLLSRRRGPHEPLGFGGLEVSALVTPVVWLAVSEAVKHAATLTVDGVAQGVRPRLRAALRRLLRRPEPPSVLPVLTPDQLDAVHRQVVEGARAAGIAEERSTALADSVVSRLARAADDAQ